MGLVDRLDKPTNGYTIETGPEKTKVMASNLETVVSNTEDPLYLMKVSSQRMCPELHRQLWQQQTKSDMERSEHNARLKDKTNAPHHYIHLPNLM